MQVGFQQLEEPPWQASSTLKTNPSETLYVYLTISHIALSEALICKENKTQLLFYYINKQFLDVKTRYTKMKKLALAQVAMFRKLHPYFHAYTIEILTNYLLKQVSESQTP